MLNENVYLNNKLNYTNYIFNDLFNAHISIVAIVANITNCG